MKTKTEIASMVREGLTSLSEKALAELTRLEKNNGETFKRLMQRQEKVGAAEAAAELLLAIAISAAAEFRPTNVQLTAKPGNCLSSASAQRSRESAGQVLDFLWRLENEPTVDTSYSLVYLGTCLPDYFLGFGGHVFAVPLSARPRKRDVKTGLLSSINVEEIYDESGEPVGESAYLGLAQAVEELFAGENMMESWMRSIADLSESYAYFGVVRV
ncbi:hypothetical protein FBPa45_0113 [Pseudomonas phage vB_PaeS_FBPa45]|uniref:Uncharacterized protein n=1 Tax=Pseudomonas phage PA_L9 TaxID=3232177 RepID=A0AAU8L064_9CAUD|nr:hypothetical protein [Pseudomonas phage BHU-1]UGV19960.1 hypothetical protein [Pseudomonas phage Pa BHU-15]UIW13600.1 hypothetical protein [Pseudomonas phage Pa BHU-17]UVN14114.1 hypothetical protein FBPa45_0113 [Pseudomonas phage vB_PaeS_FBPa45]WDS62496.1 hypothetical protein UFRH6_68 [Pseudomonas phage UF_RH6]HBO9768491.1 hypothetical protein [Pseudomonas aeruginosa]